jgi:hypothetical protein
MSLTLSPPPVPLDYPGYLRLLRTEAVELADEFASFTGVKDVLDWMQRRGLLGRDGIDMVGQDEFHYDFLIQLEPNGRWLAFGVT